MEGKMMSMTAGNVRKGGDRNGNSDRPACAVEK